MSADTRSDDPYPSTAAPLLGPAATYIMAGMVLGMAVFLIGLYCCFHGYNVAGGVSVFFGLMAMFSGGSQ